MRRPGPAADPPCMGTATIVIVLDLDEAADCPRGTASANGATHPFHGWLAFAAAIEALTHPKPGATAPGSDEGDHS